MLNFLPTKNKREIAFEYILRITSFVCVIIIGIVLILIGFFVPSAIFSTYKDRNVSNQLTSMQAIYQQNGGQDPVAVIHGINRMVPAFTRTHNALLADSDLATKIVSLKNTAIVITSFAFSEDASTETINLGGIAQTRDSLITFENALKGDGTFSSVVLPVQDLIPDGNAQFSITLTYPQTN